MFVLFATSRKIAHRAVECELWDCDTPGRYKPFNATKVRIGSFDRMSIGLESALSPTSDMWGVTRVRRAVATGLQHRASITLRLMFFP